MQRLLEIIFGLQRGFLSREGDFHVTFNPHWPWQDQVGAGLWNFLLIASALALVIWVYRREARSRAVRITLGAIRGVLLAFVIILLNRPVLTLTQSRIEPSVVAVLIDDSISMRIRDAGNTDAPEARLAAAVNLMDADNQALVRELRKQHVLRFYSFDASATPLHSTTQPARDQSDILSDPDLTAALNKLQPTGQNTQVARSIRAVLDDLQGQRLAGIVVLTDGRDTPAQPLAGTLALLKDVGVKIFPVAVGSESAPSNVELQSVATEDSVFKGDIANVRATVRTSGIPVGRTIAVQLNDKKTGSVLTGPDGKPAEQTVTVQGDAPSDVELQFRADQAGPLDLVVEAVKQPGEIDEQDNSRQVQIAVLDAQINVLYVEGYPRWDYRYIKNEMIRDKTVNISCLLTNADPTFRQEGDDPTDQFPGPLARFPETMEELLPYDVVLFGDVDPRQFSDTQLQLISDFVSTKGGGFGMVAGPQFAPQAFRGTPIESLLPVSIARVHTEELHGSITSGFRPVLTKEGVNSSIFRFLGDKTANEKFLHDVWPPIFWYCRGVTVKPGVGEAYAEHPTETGPDGRRAPLLVFGRYGATGRTMFSAIDDSWRWRLYTGESVFDTYWVQQLRQLARGRKLGQRRATLIASRATYELGDQVRLTLRILDPQIATQLPEQLRVDLYEESAEDSGPRTEHGPSTQSSALSPQSALAKQETLQRQEGANDTFTASFTADRAGKYVARLSSIAPGVDSIDLPVEVIVPRLELAQPQIDRVALSRLASETSGQVIEYNQARKLLPTLLTSAAKIIPIETPQPLWDAPLAMILFVFLITSEWIVRKLYGML